MKVDWGVIDALITAKTPATFFLSGQWMEKFPEETKKLAKVPNFELALHGYSHPHMARLSKEAIEDQLKKNQDVLKSLTGRTATHFRPPYGESSLLLVETARSLGMETVTYDVVSGDPARDFKKEKLVANVVKNAANGSIVVMHVNGRGWHTAEALPDIIKDLKEEGLAPVTVEELISGTQPGAPAQGYGYFFNRAGRPGLK